MDQVQDEVCGYTHHQQSSIYYWKKIRVPCAIEYPIKYPKYNDENYLVFSRLELELVQNILHGIVENHIPVKFDRDILLDIGAYQQFQVSEEACATNAWGELTSLNNISQCTGVEEELLKQWWQLIEELRESGHKINKLMEKTHFKELI